MTDLLRAVLGGTLGGLVSLAGVLAYFLLRERAMRRQLEAAHAEFYRSLGAQAPQPPTKGN